MIKSVKYWEKTPKLSNATIESDTGVLWQMKFESYNYTHQPYPFSMKIAR